MTAVLLDVYMLSRRERLVTRPWSCRKQRHGIRLRVKKKKAHRQIQRALFTNPRENPGPLLPTQKFSSLKEGS